MHDFLTVGAPAPLQEAVAVGLGLGRPYYDSLATEYRKRRDLLVPALEAAGFAPRRPEGAYYVLCDITPFGFDDDVAFARWLVSEVGVAGVPGSSFYSEPALGKHLIRFTFCKTHDVLAAAAERLLLDEGARREAALTVSGSARARRAGGGRRSSLEGSARRAPRCPS